MTPDMILIFQKSKWKTLGFYLIFCFFYMISMAFDENLFAQGRYGEINLRFSEPKKFWSRFEPNKNILTIEFPNVTTQELEPLNLYDPNLVHRILIKDKGPEGHEVKLELKDSNIIQNVSSRDNPFRISIQFFDRGYTVEKDKITDLPLASTGPVNTKLNPSEMDPIHKSDSSEKAQLSLEQNNQDSIFLRSTKRKLLQPLPEEFSSFKDWRTAFEKVKPGRGQSWKEYPVYIYAFPLSAYESRSSPPKGKRVSLERFPNDPSEQAKEIASISYKSYIFGDEYKALHGYQQILYKDPSIFEKEVVHLWALAEIHLGQKNLSLAQGYYKFLIETFPESSFRQLAELRLLDIRALKMISSDNFDEQTALILKDLGKIQSSENNELLAQIGLREAYWQNKNWMSGLKNDLPLISKLVQMKLRLALSKVESKFTAFLVSSLLIRSFVEENEPWTKESSDFARDYFERTPNTNEFPFVLKLKHQLGDKFSKFITRYGSEDKLDEILRLNEFIPNLLRSYINQSSVDWFIAESYRKSNQWQTACLYYLKASEGPGSPLEKTKALFWLAELSGSIYSDSKSNKYKELAMKSDRNLYSHWTNLTKEDQSNFENAYRVDLEKTLDQEYKFKTYPKIILKVWEESLSTKTSGQDPKEPKNSDITKQSQTFSSYGVKLLAKLQSAFEGLGLSEERSRSLKLFEKFDPKDFSEDKAAQQLWSERISNTAEFYRKQNNFLKSGELYILLGERTLENEKRAEHLYKGSLLLYRAGKREDAIKGLTKASQDNNNLFYANLSKERLNKIQK